MIYTAEQLRKMAKDSRINLDKLMEECKEKASDYDYDDDYIYWYDHLNYNEIQYLENLGFTVEKEDEYGNDYCDYKYKITWNEKY